MGCGFCWQQRRICVSTHSTSYTGLQLKDSVGFSISLLDSPLVWTLGDGNDGTPVSVLLIQRVFVLTTVSSFADYVRGDQCYRCSGQPAVDVRARPPVLDTTLSSTVICRVCVVNVHGWLSPLLDLGPQPSAPVHDRLTGLKRLRRKIDRPAMKSTRSGDKIH